jgi:phosphoenolpyruvate---glycerone phosphotransferase subunit DhaL
MDAEVFRAWIVSAAGVIEANRDHLTQLDAAIGDADHGINLARGFTAVLDALDARRPRAAAPTTPGKILTLTGNTIVSKVGGASGPLYGTAFRRAGRSLGDAAEVDLPALSAALDAALAGIQQLGAAREGDKTMVTRLWQRPEPSARRSRRERRRTRPSVPWRRRPSPARPRPFPCGR